MGQFGWLCRVQEFGLLPVGNWEVQAIARGTILTWRCLETYGIHSSFVGSARSLQFSTCSFSSTSVRIRVPNFLGTCTSAELTARATSA